MTTVHLEVTNAIGRVYLDGRSYDARDPFDAVFTVLFLGDGKAKLIAAHGKIGLSEAGAIARKLREDHGIEHVEMERHGRPWIVETERVSGFGELT
jgi:hypothetical protein